MKSYPTWFGGYFGALISGDSDLHLLTDDGPTFCGLKNPVKADARTANRTERFCFVCLDAVHAVRRDVPMDPFVSELERAQAIVRGDD